MVIIAKQCEYTQCKGIVHLKMVKKVNFVMYIPTL